MLTEAECRELAQRAVSLSRADEVLVSLTDDEATHLRFARNTPSTAGTYTGRTLAVTSTLGTRRGTATVNQLDAGSIEHAVRRSEEIAALAPEDPEFVPGLGPQAYAAVEAWSDETAERAPEAIAAGSEACIEDAVAAGLVAAGFSRADAGVECLAGSTGLFGYHRSTTAAFTETVRTPDGTGSGWACGAAGAVGELDWAGCSRVAIDKARRSARPRPLEPGDYPTILEPACVAELVDILLSDMDRRSADEGRSFFGTGGGATRLGETLFPESVSLWSDPASPVSPARPWDGDGLPRVRTDWIAGGRVANLAADRFWAGEQGVAPVAGPPNVLMAGGDATLDELVAGTERGILVTSLWYIRGVDPQTLLYTGLTRDGVFWIEDGEIAWPVNNFRWNDSPIRVLAGVEALSRPVRVASRGSSTSNAVVPALRCSAFTFSSVSEAV